MYIPLYLLFKLFQFLSLPSQTFFIFNFTTHQNFLAGDWLCSVLHMRIQRLQGVLVPAHFLEQAENGQLTVPRHILNYVHKWDKPDTLQQLPQIYLGDGFSLQILIFFIL